MTRGSLAKALAEKAPPLTADQIDTLRRALAPISSSAIVPLQRPRATARRAAA